MTYDIRRKATDAATFDEIEAAGLDTRTSETGTITVEDVHNATPSHRAYAADYCPTCGTAVVMGR